MFKDRLLISDCQEGQVLAEDIFNSYGAVVVAGGTEINSYIKQKLIDIGIESARIAGLSHDDESDSNISIFREKYDINVLTLKRTVNDLAAGKKLDNEKIDYVCDSLYGDSDGYDSIVKCLSKIRASDEYTYTHCINVALYSMLLAKWLNLPEQQIKDVVLAGMLHDIGKCRLDNELLNKKAKLLPEEFEEIKKHTVYGYEMLKDIIEIPEMIKSVALMHHEREDATGYPHKKTRDQISLYSKIVAVTDVYDAMTTDRPYKRRMTPFDAFRELKTLGICNLNQEILNVFLKKLSACLVGIQVLLNTGETGRIAYIPPMNISDPIIRIGTSYIDLLQDDTRKIINIF